MSASFVAAARDRFVAWLRWYMAVYPSEAATPAALARRLGIRKSTLHDIMARGSTRAPSFETLIAARALLGVPLDVIVDRDPPAASSHIRG